MTATTISRLETQLVDGLGQRSPGASSRSLGLLVTGAPGSGKTTLVRALSQEHWLRPALTYVEEPQANPHLADGHEGLVARQEWFLRQYQTLKQNYTRDAFVIIDQDPRAVVLVYTKAFWKLGWISTATYQRQLESCVNLVSVLENLSAHWKLLILSLPREALFQRLEARQRQLDDQIIMPVIDQILEFTSVFCASLKERHPDICHEFDGEEPIEEIVRTLKGTLQH